MCIKGLEYHILHTILYIRMFIIIVIIFLVYLILFELIIDVIYVLSTYMLCYSRLLVLSCPKNFSAHSDLVLFCAPDNKNLKLEVQTS